MSPSDMLTDIYTYVPTGNPSICPMLLPVYTKVLQVRIKLLARQNITQSLVAPIDCCMCTIARSIIESLKF